MSNPHAVRRGVAVPSPRLAASPTSWLRRALGLRTGPGCSARSGAEAGSWDVPASPRCVDDLREDVGAYVLGALTDADTRCFEAHLAGCAACQREVDDLLTVRTLLASVDPEVVTRGFGD
jgi:hypothetical protein